MRYAFARPCIIKYDVRDSFPPLCYRCCCCCSLLNLHHFDEFPVMNWVKVKNEIIIRLVFLIQIIDRILYSLPFNWMIQLFKKKPSNWIKWIYVKMKMLWEKSTKHNIFFTRTEKKIHHYFRLVRIFGIVFCFRGWFWFVSWNCDCDRDHDRSLGNR